MPKIRNHICFFCPSKDVVRLYLMSKRISPDIGVNENCI